MHVDFLNPKTNTWPAMQQRNLHLNSSLSFQDNLSFQETLLLSFSTGVHKSEICTLLYSFSLKVRARKLSWVHGFTYQKKDKSPSYLLFDSFKATTTIRKLPPLRSNTKKKENSLKLSTSHTFGSSHKEREILSCKRDSIPIFPLKNHKLGKDSSYSHLRIQGQSHIVAWGGRGPCKKFFFPIRLWRKNN